MTFPDAIHALNQALGHADEALAVSQWELPNEGTCGAPAHNALQSLAHAARGVVETWEAK